MPLLRKQPSGPDGPLGDLFEEIGLPATREKAGWAARIGPSVLYMSWIEKGRALSGFAPLADAGSTAELRELLQRNLEPRLAWFSRSGTGADGGLGARFAVPLEPFDAGAVRLAVEAVAGLLDDEDTAARARRPTGGERAEQETETRARAALEAALEAAGLRAQPDPERAGVWRVEAAGRALDAVLRDTGESVLLMHQLEYAAGDDDPEILRWLLLASDWGSARLGMADLPGAPGLFAAAAVATTAPEPPIGWGVEQLLELADEYDRRSGG
jgi:hypothetical protein